MRSTRSRSEKERRGRRKSFTAGVVFGIVAATVVAAYAVPKWKLMVKGQPARASDVNDVHEYLKQQIDKVKAELAKERDCPPGYTRDSRATGIVLCKRGKDEMVKVGDFWVDRYEMSIVDAGVYNGGKCDGVGRQYGLSTDDYPTIPGKGFPDTGNYSVRLYACSMKGNKPSASMTWFQAAAACALAGKHLCTNGEWQVAAFGTPDDASSCNISTRGKEAAGSRSRCVSKWGAYDMVGNVWEWVDWWTQAGKGWMSKDADKKSPWPTSGYGGDKTWNLDGRADNGRGFVSGIPAAPLRGGMWLTLGDAGVFAMTLSNGPSYSDGSIGARCCRH